MTKIQDRTKRIIRIGLMLSFFVLLSAFIFFNSKDLVLGIKIKSLNISDNSKISESIFELTGRAKNAVRLTLNGRQISIDERGNFNETLALLPGYNIIGLYAEDKFGNSDKKDYQIVYRP